MERKRYIIVNRMLVEIQTFKDLLVKAQTETGSLSLETGGKESLGIEW